MTTYRAIILGEIWQPDVGLCSTERTYRADDDEQAIEQAYMFEEGDFSSVKDVMILAQKPCSGGGLPHMAWHVVKEWDNEENERVYAQTQ